MWMLLSNESYCNHSTYGNNTLLILQCWKFLFDFNYHDTSVSQQMIILWYCQTLIIYSRCPHKTHRTGMDVYTIHHQQLARCFIVKMPTSFLNSTMLSYVGVCQVSQSHTLAYLLSTVANTYSNALGNCWTGANIHILYLPQYIL